MYTLLLLFLPAVWASIHVTTPRTNDTVFAGSPYWIQWLADHGPAQNLTPLAHKFGHSRVYLSTGSWDEQVDLQLLAQVNPYRVTNVQVQFNASVGPESPYYFIRFESQKAVDKAGNPLVAWSPRFRLTGMTGKFNATTVKLLEDGPIFDSTGIGGIVEKPTSTVPSNPANTNTPSTDSKSIASTEEEKKDHELNDNKGTSAFATSGSASLHYSAILCLIPFVILFA